MQQPMQTWCTFLHSHCDLPKQRRLIVINAKWYVFFPVVVVNFGRISFASGVKTIRKYFKMNFLFCFFSKYFFMMDFQIFLYDGLDSNLIVFETFDHSSLIFVVFFCIFRKIDDFWKDWNGIPGSITRNFLCVFICWKLLYTLYHEQMLNEKHRQNCNSELINLFWKSMRNRLCWKK